VLHGSRADPDPGEPSSARGQARISRRGKFGRKDGGCPASVRKDDRRWIRESWGFGTEGGQGLRSDALLILLARKVTQETMQGPRATSHTTGEGSPVPSYLSRSTGPTARRRIGLLGGSFDPVHSGHLHVARAALSGFDLERVVFVPAARAPHKAGRPRAGDADRLAMLRLAIAGEPRFETSDIELRRGGISFTIDTVRDLPHDLGLPADVEIHLILGSDNLPGLPHWHRARELLELVQPILVHREGDPDRLLEDTRATLGEALYSKLKSGYLRLPPVVVSSTQLRSSLQDPEREQLEIPSAVREYIRVHGLYGASA
jgi:nicotinate-nucleotide adenylyltransferase